MAAPVEPSEAWKNEDKCLRCRKPLGGPTRILRLYPCGHILCSDCYAMMIKRQQTRKFCDACSSCTWRPTEDIYDCQHPVPCLRFRLADGPDGVLASGPDDAFSFCGPGQRLGGSCQRCELRSRLRALTARIRASGLGRCEAAYACLVGAGAEMHGLPDKEAVIDEAADEVIHEFGFIATEQSEELGRAAAKMGLEPGFRLMGELEVTFRERKLDLREDSA